jgi:hypothetical protein
MALSASRIYYHLSKRKQKIADTVLRALEQADDAKIEAAYVRHYAGDAWHEEQFTPIYPEITVKPSGISDDLYINGQECLDDSFDP